MKRPVILNPQFQALTGLTDSEKVILNALTKSERKPYWWLALHLLPCALIFFAMPAFVMQWLPGRMLENGIDLCQRHGNVWIPLDGHVLQLCRLAALPMSMFGVFFVAGALFIEHRNRQLNRILLRLMPKDAAV